MIKARIQAVSERGNLGDYREACREFSWRALARELWPEDGAGNLTGPAVERWAHDPAAAGRPALILELADGPRTLSYAKLHQAAGRLANLLAARGLGRGQRLGLCLPPCPELYVALVAAARLGAASACLAPDLDRASLAASLAALGPRALLTSPALAPRIAEHLPAGGELWLSEPPEVPHPEEAGYLLAELAAQPTAFATLAPPVDHPLYLAPASGGAQPPRLIVQNHGLGPGLLAAGRYILDLAPGQVFLADGAPGDFLGHPLGTWLPWLLGAASVAAASPGTAADWYRRLERHRVQVALVAPRRLAQLREAGPELPRRFDLASLRHLVTTGEALPPELFFWTRDHLGVTPLEAWGSGAVGFLAIANYPTQDLKLTAVGRPLPGITAAVLDEAGQELPFLTMGELALRPAWPGVGETPGQAAPRHPGWLATGDLAVADEEGYLFLQGRNDDLVKVAGRSLGPWEVERALRAHPAVGAAAVINWGREGRARLKAFVTPAPGFAPSPELAGQLLALARAALSPELPLGEVEFLAELPRAASGKLLRRALRAREAGLPSGDIRRLAEED